MLLAKAGIKLNKPFLTTFLFSFFLTPFAALIYLNADNTANKKKTKRGGSWSTLISKAEEAQNNEEYQLARSCYQNALQELQDPKGSARHYYKKYILSKISEVNYALSLLEPKKDKQVLFRNIDSENPYLDNSADNLDAESGNSKTG